MSFVNLRKRLLRKAETEVKRYTQQAFAEVLGMSRPTYLRLEKNPERLTHEQAKRLSKYLGVTVDDIFSGRNCK